MLTMQGRNEEEILLVNPPLADVSTTAFYVMPPGLLSLAAFLRQKGELPRIMDLNITKQKMSGDNPQQEILAVFEKQLMDSQPVLVGVSVMVAGQISWARKILQSTKALFPQMLTVIGGAHASQFPRDILEHCPEIDMVVIGEGENQIMDCVHYAKNGVLPAVLADGIAYRDGKEIAHFPKTSWIPDLAALPNPAYDLVDFADYRHDTSTWHNPYKIDFGVRVPLITSRGCPTACNFCSLGACMGYKYRAMPARQVVDLIELLQEREGVNYFAVFDANFAHDLPRVHEICQEIKKRQLKIYLDMPSGLPIRETTGGMIEELAEAGMIRTCISVESGDPAIRNQVMKKNLSEDEIFSFIQTLRQYPQIFLAIDFVLGMPEDTKKSIQASIDLIDQLDADEIQLYNATPYPGTKLYEQCRRDRLFFADVPVEELWQNHQYDHSNLDYFVIKPYTLERDDLVMFRDRILALRGRKKAAYQKRMRTFFSLG